MLIKPLINDRRLLIFANESKVIYFRLKIMKIFEELALINFLNSEPHMDIFLVGPKTLYLLKPKAFYKKQYFPISRASQIYSS